MISFTQWEVENPDTSAALEEMLNVFKVLYFQKFLNPKQFMEQLFLNLYKTLKYAI